MASLSGQLNGHLAVASEASHHHEIMHTHTFNECFCCLCFAFMDSQRQRRPVSTTSGIQVQVLALAQCFNRFHLSKFKSVDGVGNRVEQAATRLEQPLISKHEPDV